MKPLIFVATLAFALPCFAGQLSAPEVSIVTNSSTSKTATGSVQGSRFSTDATQLMSCKLKGERRRIGGTSLTGECLAIDANGAQASCTTADAVFIQMIGSVTETSIVTFTTDTSASTTNTCQSMIVENSSAAIFIE